MDKSHFSQFFEGIIALESAKAVNSELSDMLKVELTEQTKDIVTEKEPHLYDYYRRTNKKYRKLFPLIGGGACLIIAALILLIGNFDYVKLQISPSAFIVSLLFFSTIFGVACGYGAYKYYVFQKKTLAKKQYKSALDAYYARFNKQTLNASKHNARLKKVQDSIEKVNESQAATSDTLILLYNKLTAPFSVRNPRGACIALEQLRERGSLKDYSAVEAFLKDEEFICGAYEDHLDDVRQSVAYFKHGLSNKKDDVFVEIANYTGKCLDLIEELKKF